MTVEYSKKFLKYFRKRILPKSSLVKRFEQRLKLFKTDVSNPLLKDHSLTGEKIGFRAFSVTGDIRIIYKMIDDIAIFYDIGTHNQVYK